MRVGACGPVVSRRHMQPAAPDARGRVLDLAGLVVDLVGESQVEQNVPA